MTICNISVSLFNHVQFITLKWKSNSLYLAVMDKVNWTLNDINTTLKTSLLIVIVARIMLQYHSLLLDV